MKSRLIYLPPIILCVLLLITPFAKAQEIGNSFNKTPQEMHDMFMKKHKTKTTVGWVTLGSGIVIAGIGFAMIDYNESPGFFGSYSSRTATGHMLVAFGGTATLVSIPFFISAGSSKRKAKLALKSEKVSVGMIDKSNNLRLSITIPF